MQVRSLCFLSIGCILSFLGASPAMAAAEDANGGLVESVGEAARSLDAGMLIEIYEETSADERQKDVTSFILPAALVLATAEGQHDKIDRIRKLLNSLEEPSSIASRLEDPLARLSPIQVDLDPMEATPEMLLVAKETRKSLLIASLAGQAEAIKRQRRTLQESELPSELKDQLVELAEISESIANAFSGTPLERAIAQAAEQERQTEQKEDHEYQLLSDYRADPDERPRGEDAEAWSVIKTREANRADVIRAQTELHTALMDGQLKKAEYWKAMQEIASTALDLKEKRAHLHYALIALRKKNLQEDREKSLSRNKEITAKLEERTPEDVSPVWPSLFTHHDLVQHAESLRSHLKTYSPTNSGRLSVCYARCVADMRVLHRILKSDLQGMTLEQRAELRMYLRELEEELEAPYTSESYIAVLNRQPEEGQLAAGTPGENSTASANAAPIRLKLTGDDVEIASYALYRSLLVMIARAGAEKDKQRLATLAQLVRESNLLTAQHRRSLNAIGSKVFTGQLTDREMALLEDPEEVLAQLAGVAGGETGSGLDLPEPYRDEAFQVLITSVLQDS